MTMFRVDPRQGWVAGWWWAGQDGGFGVIGGSWARKQGTNRAEANPDIRLAAKPEGVCLPRPKPRERVRGQQGSGITKGCMHTTATHESKGNPGVQRGKVTK